MNSSPIDPYSRWENLKRRVFESQLNSTAIDPRSSRGLLKRRVFESTLIISVIFILTVIFSSWILSNYTTGILAFLLADGIAALIAYYAYLMWNKQPIRINCNGCGGKILCNTPWICGECGHENFNIRQFPFLRHCEHCKLESKSYVCHHCERVVFLSEDRDATNPARRTGSEGRRKKQEVEGEAKRKTQFEEMQAAGLRNLEGKKFKVEEAKLDAKIEAIKKGEPEIKIQNEMDAMFDRLKEHMRQERALDEVVHRMKELVKAEFKGNRAEILRRFAIIDEWRAKQMPEAQ